MAKSKWLDVKDQLMLVEKWARDGLTEEQIAKNLGISKATMSDYKNRYAEFSTALKKGKAVIITEIENALIKRALGYTYEEVKTYVKAENGKMVKYTEKTQKQVAPDVAACFILLKNKDKGNWSDNPMKLEIEKQMMEFRKQAEEAKLF